MIIFVRKWLKFYHIHTLVVDLMITRFDIITPETET